MPKVEYREHPAFRTLDVTPARVDGDFDRALSAIAGPFEALAAAGNANPDGRPDSSDAKAIAKRCFLEAERGFADLSAVLIRSRSDWSDWEKATLERWLRRMALEYTRLARYHRRKMLHGALVREKVASGRWGRAKERADELAIEGTLTFPLDAGRKKTLRNAVARYIDRLRRLDTGGKDFTVNPAIALEWQPTLAYRSPLASVVRELELGAIASVYLGCPVSMTSVALHLNRPEDRWWAQRYADLGLPPTRTVNYHFDSNSGMLKVMLYLNEVDEDAGPFCYVERSHRWEMDLFRRISAQAAIYTLTLESPRERTLLLKMPEALGNISQFGDDVLDGSPAQAQILERERRFCSRDAGVIAFDNFGLHRGGIGRRGERLAFQLTFAPFGDALRETIARQLGAQ